MHERRANRCGTEEQWLGLVPFLQQKCGIEIWGRVLEIGAGGGWLSAEISKLPRVVEVVTTDYWPELLKERSPAIFEKLKANTAKITRIARGLPPA
jgi:protein-L-isoaspartate O-methyltransferase